MVLSLVKNINKIDYKFGNFVVITLGVICEKAEIKEDVSEVSFKLKDDKVIVGEGTNITFK